MRQDSKIIAEAIDKPTQDEPSIIRTDMIQCPNCGAVQEADVTWEQGHPFPSFVHTCADCEYIITESEWDSLTVDMWQNKQLKEVLDKVA